MDTRVENKVTLLSDTLKEFFGNKMNLARIKFFGLFISALCKVQTVCFEKPACGFDSMQERIDLMDIDRVCKLLSLVLIAFAWVYKAGIYLDPLKPIEIKKHGRRAKSLFKY
jgi:hypothetical protein